MYVALKQKWIYAPFSLRRFCGTTELPLEKNGKISSFAHCGTIVGLHSSVVAQWNWQWCQWLRWLPQATNVLKCLKNSPSSLKIVSYWPVEFLLGHYDCPAKNSLAWQIFCRASKIFHWACKSSTGHVEFLVESVEHGGRFTGPVEICWWPCEIFYWACEIFTRPAKN